MYDVIKACAAQAKYCKDRGAPHFASRDGICWRCGQNIYAEAGHPVGESLPKGRVRLDHSRTVPGITVERAAGELVTGCPFCNIRYCD